MALRKARLAGAIAATALLAAALYAAAGFWLVPRLVSERLAAEAAARGHALDIGRLRINPFTLEVDAEQLVLSRRDGAPLLELGRLTAALRLTPFPPRAWQVGAVTLSDPRVTVAVDRSGRLNWADLVASLGGDEKKAAPPALHIGRVLIERGAVHYSDRSREAPVEQRMEPIALELTDLSTLKDANGSYVLTAKLAGGGSLAWNGTVSLNPLGSSGRMQASGLALASLAQVAGPAAPVELREGTLQAAAHYAWDGVHLRLSDVALAVEGLQGGLRGGGAALASRSIALSGGHAAFPGGAVEFASARVDSLALAAGGKGPRAELASAQIGGLAVAPQSRRLRLERVQLAGIKGGVYVDAAGRLDWAQLLPAAVSSASTGKDARWTVEVGALEVTGSTLTLSHAQHTPERPLALTDVRLSAHRIAWPAAKPVEVSASMGVEGGTLSARGTVSLDPFGTVLDVDAQSLSLAVLQPVLASRADLRIASGSASARGRLSMTTASEQGASTTYTGSVALANVDLREPKTGDPLAAWKSVRAEMVKFQSAPGALDVREVVVSGLSGRFQIAENGTTNVGRVLKRDQPAKTGAEGEAPIAISVQRIRLENGRLDFADRSLPASFATVIQDLGGVINGLSSDRRSAARLQLDGRVDEYGSARIRGEINVFDPAAATNVQMTFRNIPLDQLSPYTARFAGYRMKSGKLSADLRYRVRNGELQGDNELLLDQVELGERIERTGAPDLPIALALALLKDSEGRVSLGIPVSGSLDNPEFRIRDVIGAAIRTALGNILAAPFRLLARLAGVPQQSFETVLFEAGSMRLAPPEREKLAALAKALKERPEVKLAVRPGFDSQADLRALRRMAVRQDLTRRMGLAVPPGEDPGPLDAGNAETQRAAERLFIERYDLPALKNLRAEVESKGRERDARETARAVAVAVIGRLADAIAVPEGALAALARARQQAIAQALGTAGIDAARLEAAPPAAIEAGKDGVPTRLSLAAAP